MKRLALTLCLLATAGWLGAGCARQAVPAGKDISEIVAWAQDFGLPDTSDATLKYGYFRSDTSDIGFFWVLPSPTNETRLITDLCRVTTLTQINRINRYLYGLRHGVGFEASPYPPDLDWLSRNRFATPVNFMPALPLSAGTGIYEAEDPFENYSHSNPYGGDPFAEHHAPSAYQLRLTEPDPIWAAFMAMYLFQNGNKTEAATLWESVRGDLKTERGLLREVATTLANEQFLIINDTFLQHNDMDAYINQTRALLDQVGSLWTHHERVEKQIKDATSAQAGTDHLLNRPLSADETRLLGLIDGTNNMQLYATSEGFYMWCLGHNTNRLDRPDVLVHLANMKVKAVPLLIELLQDYTPTQCRLSELDTDSLYYLSAIDDNYVAIEADQGPNPGRAATRAEKAASALRWVVETDPETNPDRLIFDVSSSGVNSLKAYQKFCRRWYGTHKELSEVESALAFVDIDSVYEDVINCVVTRGTSEQKRELENYLLTQQRDSHFLIEDLQLYIREAGTNGIALLERVRQSLPLATTGINADVEVQIFHDVLSMCISNNFSMDRLFTNAHTHTLSWYSIEEHLALISQYAPQDALTSLLQETIQLEGKTNDYLSSWTPLDGIAYDAHVPSFLAEFTHGTNPLNRIIDPHHRPLWNQLAASTNIPQQEIYQMIEDRYGNLTDTLAHGDFKLVEALDYMTNTLITTRSKLRLQGKVEHELPTVTNYIALSTDTNALISKLKAIPPNSTNNINDLLNYTERFHTVPVLINHPELASTINLLSRRIMTVDTGTTNTFNGFTMPSTLTPGQPFTTELGKALYAAATQAIQNGRIVDITVTRAALLGGVHVQLRSTRPTRARTETDTLELPVQGGIGAITHWRDLHQFLRSDPITLTPEATETFRTNMLNSVSGHPIKYWIHTDANRSMRTYEWQEPDDPFESNSGPPPTTTRLHPDHDLGDTFWIRLEETLNDSECLIESPLLLIRGFPGTRTPKPPEESADRTLTPPTESVDPFATVPED